MSSPKRSSKLRFLIAFLEFILGSGPQWVQVPFMRAWPQYMWRSNSEQNTPLKVMVPSSVEKVPSFYKVMDGRGTFIAL